MKRAAFTLTTLLFILATTCIITFGFVWTGQTETANHIRATLQAEITAEARMEGGYYFLNQGPQR